MNDLIIQEFNNYIVIAAMKEMNVIIISVYHENRTHHMAFINNKQLIGVVEVLIKEPISKITKESIENWTEELLLKYL
jgi:hypothetical protein